MFRVNSVSCPCPSGEGTALHTPRPRTCLLCAGMAHESETFQQDTTEACLFHQLPRYNLLAFLSIWFPTFFLHFLTQSRFLTMNFVPIPYPRPSHNELNPFKWSGGSEMHGWVSGRKVASSTPAQGNFSVGEVALCRNPAAYDLWLCSSCAMTQFLLNSSFSVSMDKLWVSLPSPVFHLSNGFDFLQWIAAQYLKKLPLFLWNSRTLASKKARFGDSITNPSHIGIVQCSSVIKTHILEI